MLETFVGMLLIYGAIVGGAQLFRIGRAAH